MRRRLTAAAVGLLLVVLVVVGVRAVLGRGDGDSGDSSAPPAGCTRIARPPTPLLTELRQRPSEDRAECLARTYTNVVAPPAWSDLPDQLHEVDPGVRVWETRVLQYGFTPCDGCPAPALDPAEVRRDHPEWILRDSSGAPVHPPAHPHWVMFDIANVDYLEAWANAAVAQLSKDGWSGVMLVDAGNHRPWLFPPVDPATGTEMTTDQHAQQLAEAMATVRGGLKTNGFSMVAENGPASVIDAGQIGSTDAVSVGRGFARLSGTDWDSLFEYFQVALDVRVGAWVWDAGTLDRPQRVFGLASYLLVSGLGSSYAVIPGGFEGLYQLDPGLPTTQPVDDAGVWTRQFETGAVAVNPGLVDGVVSLPGAGDVTVPAGGAVIDVSGRITSSSATAGSG